MGLYRIDDKTPGFRSGPLMHLGIFVKKKKKKWGGGITKGIESWWWESSFHPYGYAIKDSDFLGTLQEKIIYYPSLHCQPQWAWKFLPLCLLDAVLHFHNENHLLFLKKFFLHFFQAVNSLSSPISLASPSPYPSWSLPPQPLLALRSPLRLF